MYVRWLRALRPLVDGERALRHVEQIAQHHRIQASPGYEEAARALGTAAFVRGFVVEYVGVKGDGRTNHFGCVMPEGWDCEHARAALVDATGTTPLADFASEPLSLIQRSTPASGRWPLVCVPDGTRAEHYAGIDVRGRVVLTEGAVQRVHEQAVVTRGAAGILSYGRRLVPPARTRDHDRDSLAYTSFWWAGDEPRGWGFVVSPARGEALRERLASGESLALDADIATRRFETSIRLVSAVLPGESEGEVLLTAHLCHPKPGANDNASGVAATYEAMNALAALAADGGLGRPHRTIRVLWMPEFTGTYAWLEREAGSAARTVAVLNLDMVGEDQAACASVQQVERPPHFAASFADVLLAQVRLAARDGLFEPADALRSEEVRYSGGSDHAIWLDPAVGVPAAALAQWPDRFYHSNIDTPDRCDPRSLAHAALTAATWAATLATADRTTLEWLGGQIERGAQRELRDALAAPEPARAVRAAIVRAHGALASLGRLRFGAGAPGPTAHDVQRVVASVTEAIEDVRASEVPASVGAEPHAVPAAVARVPQRLQAAPLVLPRNLQAGWERLSADARDALLALEASVPGGSTALDLAWYACDGRRSLDEIAECLADEGERVPATLLGEWFERLRALGVCAWQAAEVR